MFFPGGIEMNEGDEVVEDQQQGAPVKTPDQVLICNLHVSNQILLSSFLINFSIN
jgi:hypothetical protein